MCAWREDDRHRRSRPIAIYLLYFGLRFSAIIGYFEPNGAVQRITNPGFSAFISDDFGQTRPTEKGAANSQEVIEPGGSC